MCNFTNMIGGGLILYVRAPSLDHFVFENKNVKILFRFCRRHYFDLRIISTGSKKYIYFTQLDNKNVLLKLYTELYNSKRTFKSKYLRQKSTIVNSYIYIRKSFL